MKRIYLSPPHMTGNELTYIKEAIDQNWVAPIGPQLNEFESKISKYVGINYAIGVSSGTAGLHLALKAIGIKEGDYVLCSDLTFIGSVNPILYCGANPIFVDSEKESWNMDHLLLEEEIQRCIKEGIRPKALILVHVFGMMGAVGEIVKICRKYNIPLVEDAAESLGSIYKEIHTGTIGDIGVYSFNGNKLLTTSGGGIIVTQNKEYADRIRFLSTQAKDAAPYYQHSEIGFNYRLSNILAAIGIAQIDVIEERIEKTRRIHKFYIDKLGDHIDFLVEDHGNRSNIWLTCGILKNSSKTPGELVEILENHNIEARRIWNPMHCQPVLKEHRYVSSCPSVSKMIFDRGICFPSGTNMTEHDLDRVIKASLSYLQ